MDTVANSAQGVIISTVGWIAIGVTAWLVVALIVGVLIGRMIRRRETQVPRDPDVSRGVGPSASPGTPAPAPAPTPDSVGRPHRD